MVKDGVDQFNSRRLEDVFRDFKGRRSAIIKALTTDVDDFSRQCDPEKENLCLYGYPNESWDVNQPAEKVPPDMPEPLLGINFAKDGMQEKDWLSFIATHSDSWLLAVAFYFGAYFGLDKSDRGCLFNMINDLPTILETVTGTVNKQAKNKSSVSNHSSNNSKSKSAFKRGAPARYAKSGRVEEQDEEEGVEEEDDEQKNTVCGECNEYNSEDEFWICCDQCETWFHVKCVKITAAKAARIREYICPSCSTKKPRRTKTNSAL